VPNVLTAPLSVPPTVPNVSNAATVRNILHRTQSVLILIVAATLLATGILPAQNKPETAKLPKPTILEKTVRAARDPATGELRTGAMDDTAEVPGATPPIRARVTLVSVTCSVTAPDGTRIRGLGRDDFRVFEDGVAQTVASFDAAETPASIAVILDASPSIYREFGEMRDAARSLSSSLAPEDEVAVVAFAAETNLLLPFSRNRGLLGAALASPELARVANSSQSFIYQAVFLTAAELFRDRAGRKAIVLLTDGQDSGLGLTWDAGTMQPRQGAASPLAFEDVARELAARGIELYVISTEHRPQAMTDAWLDAHRGGLLVTPEARKLGMPQYTLYLAEMVREVGGGLYFLREIGGLAEVYHRIALTLGAEYTLGYYPVAGIAKPGWRSLRVDLRPGAASPQSRVTHRAAYYVPAVASNPQSNQR
jgi:Ca-activated chloride channel family protein